MAIGEVGIYDAARLVRYFGDARDELHLAFNFAFLAQPWRAEAFRDSVDQYEHVLPAGGWPTYTLSNHDNPRARSRYDPGDGSGARRARLAAMLLLTLRGTPFLYYGEEIGQADGEVPADRVVDRDGRDPERTPMQWDSGHGAGFTTGDAWLPVGSEAPTANVAAQRNDPRSILSLYRRLIWYRRGSAALRWGSYRSIGSAPGVFAFLREAGPERLLIALNFRASRAALRLVDQGPAGSSMLAVSTDPDRSAGPIRPTVLELGPDEGVIVRL